MTAPILRLIFRSPTEISVVNGRLVGSARIRRWWLGSLWNRSMHVPIISSGLKSGHILRNSSAAFRNNSNVDSFAYVTMRSRSTMMTALLDASRAELLKIISFACFSISVMSLQNFTTFTALPESSRTGLYAASMMISRPDLVTRVYLPWSNSPRPSFFQNALYSVP